MSTKWLRKVPLTICFLLVFGLLMQSSSANEWVDSSTALTITKEETVYANLKGDGRVDEIYVVNAFTDQTGEIVDFGEYEEIINLTGNDKPLVEDEKIIFNSNPTRPFYYQGKLSKGSELPWLFTITYELNGKIVDFSTLPGAGGHLKVLIEIEHNINRESFFHDNYMLQVSVPLSFNHCLKIIAPGAAKIVVGQIATFNYTILAGEEGVFTIEADVIDFEMSPIQITAVKSDLDLADLEGEIAEGFEELSSGLVEMIDGTSQLKAGTVEVNRGIGDLHNGVTGLGSGGSKLVESMDNYDTSLNDFSDALTELRAGSREMESGFSGAAAGLQELNFFYGEIGDGLTALLTNKEQLTALASGLSQSPDAAVKMLADAMLAQLGGLEQADAALRQANSGLSELSEGVVSIGEQYAAFDQGIETLANGSDHLTAGYSELFAGVRQSVDGVREIQAGTEILKAETASLPAALHGLLDGQKEMLNSIISAKNNLLSRTVRSSEVETLSFAAPGVTIPGSVQFLMQTPAVEKPIELRTPVETEAAKLNIWERFLNLFR